MICYLSCQQQWAEAVRTKFRYPNIISATTGTLAGLRPLYLFDRHAPGEDKHSLFDKEETDLEHGNAVRCGYCKSVITYQGNAEPIQGRQVHKFVNPGGYEFVIGCYRRAWCNIMGLPILEWSWFHGCTWQYAMCPQCHEHLGWFYQCAEDDSSFYGLILDRLIIDPSSGQA